MTDSFNNFFNQLLDEGQNAVSVSQNGVVKPVTLIHGIPVKYTLLLWIGFEFKRSGTYR